MDACPRKTVAPQARGNVEKGPIRTDDVEVYETEVLSFEIETDELRTVESFGAGVCVLLFLACLDSKTVYFVNLTDLIEKVVTPKDPEWRAKGSKVIKVPTRNEVTPTSQGLTLLRFYGLRPKLMGLFNKIHYQREELEYADGEVDLARWWGIAAHFAQVLLCLDVWDYEGWEILGIYRDELEAARKTLATTVPSEETRAACLMLWQRLDVIGRTFEEIAREWGLPTPLGLLTS